MYKWDAGEALKLIEQEKITAVTGVPIMARELLSHPDFDKYDTSSVKGLGGGGAPLQPDLVGKIAETPARPGTGYGMTETSGVITSIGGDFFIDRPTSAGPVMPNFDALLVDEEGGPHGDPSIRVLDAIVLSDGMFYIRHNRKRHGTNAALFDGGVSPGMMSEL